MFCPVCGALSFPDSSGNIKCPDYNCGYSGTAENKVLMEDGTEIDISKAASSSKTEARDRRVIDDADQQRGVLTTRRIFAQNVIQIAYLQNFNKLELPMNRKPGF